MKIIEEDGIRKLVPEDGYLLTAIDTPEESIPTYSEFAVLPKMVDLAWCEKAFKEVVKEGGGHDGK